MTTPSCSIRDFTAVDTFMGNRQQEVLSLKCLNYSVKSVINQSSHLHKICTALQTSALHKALAFGSFSKLSHGPYRQLHLSSIDITGCSSNRRHFHTTTSPLAWKWCEGQPQKNPLDMLQEVMEEPIINPEDYVFKPKEEEMQLADKLFHPGKERKLLQPVRGVVNLEDIPKQNLPEVSISIGVFGFIT